MTTLIATGLALVMSAHAQPNYHFRAVEFPGAANTAVYAVNDRGQFVGAEKDLGGAHHAIFDDGRQGLRLLDPQGLIGTSEQSWAYSINTLGDIAGSYDDSEGVRHGYVRHTDGNIMPIEFPKASATEAFGVNDLGIVIGIYTDSSGDVHAFLLEGGHYRNIDLPGGLPSFGTIPFSINDLGEIVGAFARTDGTNGFGFLRIPGGRFTLTTAPGSAPEQTYYISINNRQQILGQFLDPAGATHSFLKTGNDFRPFDLPASFGASFVQVETVNDLDEIVGYYFDAGGVAHGFVATRAW